MKRKFVVSTCFLVLTLLETISCQFIRPLNVYQNMVDSVRNFYNSTCVIFLHASSTMTESIGLDETQNLLQLHRYVSGDRWTRSSIMDLEMFTNQVGSNYRTLIRPLFVLMNDSEDLRREFKNVSTWIKMAYPIWLMFASDDASIEDFMNGIYVPFDSQFLVTKKNGSSESIIEVYQIDQNGKLHNVIYGQWNPEEGLRTPQFSLFERRKDLEGHNLRIATIYDPPASYLVNDEDGNLTRLSGYFGNMIHIIQDTINCSLTLIEADSWGTHLPNGTWTGSIGMLVRGEVDMVAAEFLMTSDRMDAIEFTTPIYITKYRTFIKRPTTNSVKWTAYTVPFHEHVWSCIIVIIILSSVTLSVLKIFFTKILSYVVDYSDTPSTFSETLFDVFSAFCSQGMQQSILNPIRVAQLVIQISGIVILAAYSAALISSLAVKTFTLPFTSIKGLLDDGSYRFGVIDDSADFTYFQNTTDESLKYLFHNVLKREKTLPRNYLEGLRNVCEEKDYAFMTLDIMKYLLQDQVDCQLEPLDSLAQMTVAMTLRAGNPYRGVINRIILLIRDNGIFDRLLKTIWVSESLNVESNWSAVEIFDVVPLLLLMLVGIIGSLILLIIEKLAYQNLATNSKRRKKQSMTRSILQ